ncbi:MAG: gliding motility-associated C-terminal domain-containing protein [Crocinitomicaceae bacterium]|nr:gliding motility-associated C-terminal domain-containing protein [Crocinitomicaceae bacterium]
MKRLLLLSVSIALTCVYFAQTTTSFRKNYNISLFDLPVTTIEGLTPNTYIFSGFHAFNSSITAIDNTGVTTWSKQYSSGTAMQIGDIKKDENLNRYYVCGGVGSGPAFLMFLDINGDLISGRNFSISQASGANFNRVIKTSDGGYLCVGTVTGYDPDGPGPEVQFSPVTHNPPECTNSTTATIQSPLIVKFDAAGNHMWHEVFRYYVGSATPANRIYNDARFIDVVEISDGYLVVGNYKVNNVFSVYDTSSGNSCGQDRTPTDAMIAKFSFTGNLEYHRQIDNPSNLTSQSSKSFNSASLTTAGLPLVSGSDGSGRPMMLMSFAGSGGFAAPTWIRKYGASSFFGTFNPFQPGRFFETSDGNYAVWGFHINPLSFLFSNVLFQMDPAGSIQWQRQYTSNVAILPHGQQTSDDGFIGMSYTISGAGHNLHVIKTDPNGNTSVDCPASSISISVNTPSFTWGTPIFNSWNTNTVTNATFSPSITAISPTETIECLTIVATCIPPALADNVTATPNPICEGQQTTINASGPGTNVSYNVFDAATGGTNIGEVPLSVSPTVTTTYYIETFNTSDPNCVSTTRVPITVTVNPSPIANPQSNSPLCVGQTLNLTTDAAPGATYSWTGPNSFTSAVQNPTISNAQLANSGSYSLTVTAGGCSTGPIPIEVIVSESPNSVPNASNTTVCAGQDIELIGNTVPGGSYLWNGPNGFTSTDQNPVINGATSANAGSYSLVISVGACSSSSESVTITVNPSPVANAGAVQTTICEGNDIELTSNTVTGGTYSWTGPNGFTSTNQNPSITNTTSANSGTYSLVITANGCPSLISNVTITVEDTPIASANAVSTELCEGDNLELIATTLPGGSYSWTGPNGFTSADQNPTIINTSGANAGTYSLIVTVGDCPSAADEVTITVNPAPVANANNNGPVCVGNSIELSATGGGSYAWTGPNGFTSNDQNPSITNASLLAAGVYEVSVTVGSCFSNAQTTVAIVDAPNLTVSSDDVSCNGANDGEITVNATGNGPFNFVWTPNVGTGSNVSNLTPGSYLIIVTDDNGCSSNETISISEPDAIVLTTSSTASQCIIPDGTAEVSVTGGMAPYSFVWSSGGSTATETNIGPGTYTVTVTDGNGCSEQAQVTVPSINGPSLTLESSTNVSCFGANDGAATVNVTAGTPGYTFNWLPSGGNNATASGLGQGTFTVFVTDEAGCLDSLTIQITEPDQLVANSTVNNSNCGLNDGAISLTVSGGSPSYSYTWTPNVGNSAAVSNLTPGTYAVQIEDANGCIILVNETINTTGFIPIEVVPQTATINAGDNVNLEVIIGGGITDANVIWSPTAGLSCTACVNPIAGPSETTTYFVTVTTDDGCVSSDSLIVFVNQPCDDLFVPNIFSPNGDGNNDFLCVYGSCIESFNFSIFNRWGEKVFESGDPSDCWDGTFRNKALNSGVFAYKLVVRILGESENRVESGNITLVR